MEYVTLVITLVFLALAMSAITEFLVFAMSGIAFFLGLSLAIWLLISLPLGLPATLKFLGEALIDHLNKPITSLPKSRKEPNALVAFWGCSGNAWNLNAFVSDILSKYEQWYTKTKATNKWLEKASLFGSYVFFLLFLLPLSVLFLAGYFVTMLTSVCVTPVVLLADRIASTGVMKYHGCAFQCPRCSKRIKRPHYHCPHCFRSQQALKPSFELGIFRRRCVCGTLMPTSTLWGREQLKTTCPYCHQPLEGMYVPMTVAFLGGTSVGKTFLCRCICTAMEEIITKGQWEYHETARDSMLISQMRQEMENGENTMATQYDGTGLVDAVCVDVTNEHNPYPRRIYFYDPPGESFDETARLRAFRYYEYLKTVFVVLDPFSIPEVRQRFQNVISDLSNELGASTKSTRDSIERWLNAMNRYYPGVVEKISCIVVINKTDIPGLGLQPGASSEQCRAFLHKYGMGDLISLLEQHFVECEVFAVSCTGGATSSHKYRPMGIQAPVYRMISYLFEDDLY